jgi:hypothetical protein
VEKHDRMVPSDKQIRSALMLHTEVNIDVDRMWENIEAKLDAKPTRRWQPWLGVGTAAAVLFMIVLLNWQSPPHPPEQLMTEEPQIMRFSAIEPLSAAAEVVGTELFLMLTAHQDLEIGPGPTVVEVLEANTLTTAASTATLELSGSKLMAGETAELRLEMALPAKGGHYQVRVQLELYTAEAPEEVSIFAPLIMK